MAVADMVNINGEKISEVTLSDEIFGVPVKPGILHDVVVMQMARRRSNSASVKGRGDVRGSTRKLYRQKGTGRARRGDVKSPVMVGGGVAFGPTERNYTKRIPKKVRKLALRMALSSKLRDSELLVVDQIELDAVGTKKAAAILKTLERENSLVIIPEKNETLELSFRNLPNAKILRADGLNVYDILKYEHLLLLESSVPAIEGRFAA